MSLETIKRVARLVSILVAVAPSIAAGSSMDPTPANTDFKARVAHKMVAGTLMQLRDLARGQGKTELLALLNRTRISVPSKSLEQQSPNAYAYSGANNQKWILIEKRWMDQVAGFADLAALFAIAEAGWGLKEQFHDIYRDYCNRFQQEFRNRPSTSQSVVYQFKITDYYSRSDSRNAVFHITYDKVAGVTFVNTIAWTVLHEMGHHALKHTSVINPGKAERRRDELAADWWAFEQMQLLGLSLYPVGAYFLAREWSENCFRNLGLVGNEAERTHPLWYNRGTPLFNISNWRNAADQVSRIYFVPMGLAGGKADYIVFSISDPSKNTPQATIIQFGRAVPAIAEWNQNSAIIYVRNTDRGRFEYTLKNPYQVMVLVEQRQYDAQNRLVGTVELQAIQQDAATFDYLTTGGIRFADVRARVESGDSWKRHLRNLGVSASNSAQARARRDRYTVAKNELDTTYMKGNLTVADYIQRMTQVGNQYKADLTRILGATPYQQLYDTIVREVNSYAPFLLNPDQNWEENMFRENFGQ